MNCNEKISFKRKTQMCFFTYNLVHDKARIHYTIYSMITSVMKVLKETVISHPQMLPECMNRKDCLISLVSI